MILKGEFGWGTAEGKIWRLPALAALPRKRVSGNSEQILKDAFARLATELEREKRRLKKGKEFLDFPLSVLHDPQLWDSIRGFLHKGFDAGQAVVKAFTRWEKAFKKLDDSYLRLRIQDLQDLRRRILSLLAEQPSDLVPRESFIAVGRDLFVTDFLRLQRTPLQGIALEEGNESAHGVMLAKALGVPLVGRVKGLLSKARERELAILSRDQVYIHERPKKGTGPVNNLEIGSVPFFKTKDKAAITVRANVQLPEEIEKAKAAGAMGIGLFRTEFLWMKGLSTKAESDVYREAMEAFFPDPVVFRLADVGSDKPYAKIKWPPEKNPALGWRGLRFLLDRPEILNRQLEALFSAAGDRTLHLLLPMVRTWEEVKEFLTLLKPFTRKQKTKVGIMVETPSSVEVIEHLPGAVSFVSLGTNDLLQYFFAVDRIHPSMKADPLDPAFLRFLQEILRRCRRAKKSVSVCGEMAADPKGLAALIGLGVREFSVSVSKIPDVQRVLLRLSARNCGKLAAKILVNGTRSH